MADSVGLYGFLITEGAQEDMRKCKEDDAWAATRISVFLREVITNHRAAEALVNTRYSDEKVRDIAELASFRTLRVNAYRIKLIEISGWRLIAAVDHPTKRVALMAIMNRDDDYQNNTQLWNDIEREYDELGFARV